MNAEIITIGDELLLGQVIDTNSAWMGLQLADIGVSVTRRTAIGDSKEAIINAIDEAKTRVSLVFLTGGLGPTRDDVTKNALCSYYNCGYRMDNDVMVWLEEIFKRRGRTLLESNKKQAELPERCTTLFNRSGTAPGMLFDEDGLVLISMPGVPGEMKHIMTDSVLPWLPQRFTLPVFLYKTMLVTGIPESLLAEKLKEIEDNLPGNMKLAYLPSYSAIRLRLSAKGAVETNLRRLLDDRFDAIKSIVGVHLLAETDKTPAQAVGERLIREGKTISLAESCTGGFITNQLVQVPGISAALKCGIVSYANEIKMQELGVPAEIFNTVGAVSEECARYMVEGCLKRFNTDFAISTTGIAGPSGGSDSKPVGLIYIGVANRNKTIVREFNLPGNRQQFMERAYIVAMDLMREVM